MPPVFVSPFAESDIDEAVVLARLADLDITAERLRSYVAQSAASEGAGGRGLVARDSRGRLSGLLLFAISRLTLRHSCLQVEHLICFDLFEPTAIADALIAEMLRLAALEGCEHLSLARPMPGTDAAAALVRTSNATALLRAF